MFLVLSFTSFEFKQFHSSSEQVLMDFHSSSFDIPQNFRHNQEPIKDYHVLTTAQGLSLSYIKMELDELSKRILQNQL